MVSLYIDESGSMTSTCCESFPYFVICIVKVNDKKRLKVRFQRFISKHMDELRKIDVKNKMFKDGSFYELKGSSLTSELKNKIANYLCWDNIIEIYYIKVDNIKVVPHFYDSPARAFNYLLGLSLGSNLKNGNLPSGCKYNLQVDDQNIRTKSINTLKEYLMIKLNLEVKYLEDLSVDYCDSSNSALIQVSDFFSNLYYSSLFSNKYTELIKKMEEDGYIKNFFKFPLC